ncbi:MAG: hypothetical protein IBJ14_04930 [Hydrogenophaga sp.]|nr:hypothetical protein [Hydrogenophaga sp.]
MKGGVITTTIEALTAPIDDTESHPVYGYLGFLSGALESDRHREVLFDKFCQIKDGTPYCKAVRSAIVLFRRAAEDDTKVVAERGQLLFCWPGTTVLKGAQQ